jgi:hypothetical protein
MPVGISVNGQRNTLGVGVAGPNFRCFRWCSIVIYEYWLIGFQEYNLAWRKGSWQVNRGVGRIGYYYFLNADYFGPSVWIYTDPS